MSNHLTPGQGMHTPMSGGTPGSGMSMGGMGGLGSPVPFPNLMGGTPGGTPGQRVASPSMSQYQQQMQQQHAQQQQQQAMRQAQAQAYAQAAAAGATPTLMMPQQQQQQQYGSFGGRPQGGSYTPQQYAMAQQQRTLQQQQQLQPRPRGRGRPPGPSAATLAAIAANGGAPVKAQEAAAAATRRRKRKMQDKEIPEKVAAFIPESATYTQLLEFEKRVDATLGRKKLDVKEALLNPERVPRKLRTYIFNTYKRADPEAGVPASWALHIQGRLVNDALAAAPGMLPEDPGPAFTSFLKGMEIRLDPALYPGESGVVSWVAGDALAPTEGFELKREGAEEFTVKIVMHMNWQPERYKLSPDLSATLGVETETRPRVISALWQYIKAKNLQNPNEPSLIQCDARLESLFGEKQVKFSTVAQKIHEHLLPAQPIEIEYKVRLSGEPEVEPDCFDISVDAPSGPVVHMGTFVDRVSRDREVDRLNDRITHSIRKINEHKRRRAFFLGFSHSPVDFVNAMIASQARDLKVAAGQGPRHREAERRTDLYSQPWVEDALLKYLHRRLASGPAGE